MNEILKERFFKLEQELELADAEIAKLKAENARLAAALNKAKVAYDRLYSFHGTPTPPPNLTCDQKQCDWCEVGEALDEPSTVLRDLLAPTIELLRQCTLRPVTWQDDVKAELQRLRALCGEGKQVDK